MHRCLTSIQAEQILRCVQSPSRYVWNNASLAIRTEQFITHFHQTGVYNDVNSETLFGELVLKYYTNLWETIVNNSSDIWFVNSHSKCYGGHHNLHKEKVIELGEGQWNSTKCGRYRANIENFYSHDLWWYMLFTHPFLDQLFTHPSENKSPKVLWMWILYHLHK